MQTKNKTAFNHQLNKMNDKTYELRRKVVDILYEIKRRGYKIPRIEVRIVSGGDSNNCGYAYLGKNIIHINEKYVNHPMLSYIVLHEVVHAVTAFKHDKNCYLMQAYLPKIQDEKKMWECFSKYIN